MDSVRRGLWASDCPCCQHDGGHSGIAWRPLSLTVASFVAFSMLQESATKSNTDAKHVASTLETTQDSASKSTKHGFNRHDINDSPQSKICKMHQSNRPNPRLSKAVMFSCSCRRFGNTRLHLQPLKSRHLQEKYKK